MKNLQIILDEIKILLINVENKEKELLELNNINSNNIIMYKSFLENIINEYHSVCKKIYN